MSEPKPSYHNNPTEPKLKLPAGSCDSHFHVFGPKAKFPFAKCILYMSVARPLSEVFVREASVLVVFSVFISIP